MLLIQSLVNIKVFLSYKCISKLYVLILEQYLAYICYIILRMTSEVFQYFPWGNVMSRVGQDNRLCHLMEITGRTSSLKVKIN